VAKVTDAQPLTPHNEALYEAGKKLLVDSVEVGREFCKLMITTALSAVPIYLSLLQLALPKDYRASVATGAVLMLPAVLFVVCAVVSVFGYLPQLGSFSLDLPGEIELRRERTIRRRRSFAHWSLGILVAGTLIGTAAILWGYTLVTEAPPPLSL
jgi:hypothetical protein